MNRDDAPFGAVPTRKRLRTSITNGLVESIVNGTLPSGTSLPAENVLAGVWDVSRQVVREAASQLAAMGLIESRQGRTHRVAPRDSWNQFAPEVLLARRATGTVDEMLLDLLEFRRMLEPEAARLAAQRRTDEDVERLRAHLAALDLCVLAGARQDFVEHDIAFHQEILRSTKNEILPQLFVQLQVVLEFAREISVMARDDALLLSQDGHRAIFDGICGGDPERSRTAMTEHLSWTAKLGYEQQETRLKRSP